MFKVFISEKNLKKVIQEEGAKPEASRSYLFKILKALKKPYVTQESADLSWIEDIKNNFGITPDVSKSDYIKNIQAKPETVLQHPSSLFILDIPLVEAAVIRKKYGVMCVCGDNMNAALLIDVNDEHTICEGETLGNGWSTVLKSITKQPSNGLLLIDRYLFSAYNPKAGNGIDNVKSILDALLPQEFGDKYHVTIIFDSDSIHARYTFNSIVSSLDKVIESLYRNYPIQLEVVGITPDCEIYNSLHNRRIVSNYYIIKVEHKLAAFDKNRSTALQTITPQSLFTIDSLNNHSSPPLKAIEHTIASVRKFSRSVPKHISSNIYCYAINGKRLLECGGIKNRLLK